jgi:Xaa-Pro aminopeptidase
MYIIYGNEKTEPSVRYLTGFTAPDDVAVIVEEDKTTLIVNELEYGRAIAQSRDCIVQCPTTILGKRGLLVDCIGEYALKNGCKEIFCTASFPHGLVVELKKHYCIKTTIGDTEWLEKRRMVKTDEEIAKIATVQKVTHKAMEAAGELIASAMPNDNGELLLKDGTILTSEIVKHKIRMVCIENNCIDEGTIVAGGIQGVNPHEEGHGPLYANEWIVIDIFPRSLSNGYWGDMTRTFMNGTPSEAQKRQYNIVQRAHDEAIAMVRNGILSCDIHNRVCELFEENGFETTYGEDHAEGFFHSTGHGVGLEIHEGPRVSRNRDILSTNMVVTIEPGLYYSATGGVRIEDLVVVAPNGAIVL